MKFTVLGSRGFIGSYLLQHLEAQGHQVSAPGRDVALNGETDAGHVIYAIGLTGDFRHRLHETIEAQVTVLSHLLQTLRFDSFLYLSSTRIYGGLPADQPAGETSPLRVVPNADTVYDLSKLLGEALCLAQPRNTVRVARLSHVFGIGQSEDQFLGAVLSEACKNGRVTIGEAPQSSKDYIDVEAVVPLLERIALEGRERIYNVASGTPCTHATLAKKISEAFGATVEFAPQAPLRIFPPVDIGRIRSEFGLKPSSILDYIASLRGQQEKQCPPQPPMRSPLSKPRSARA